MSARAPAFWSSSFLVIFNGVLYQQQQSHTSRSLRCKMTRSRLKLGQCRLQLACECSISWLDAFVESFSTGTLEPTAENSKMSRNDRDRAWSDHSFRNNAPIALKSSSYDSRCSVRRPSKASPAWGAALWSSSLPVISQWRLYQEQLSHRSRLVSAPNESISGQIGPTTPSIMSKRCTSCLAASSEPFASAEHTFDFHRHQC